MTLAFSFCLSWVSAAACRLSLAVGRGVSSLGAVHRLLLWRTGSGLQWLTALGLSSCSSWALGYKCFVFDSRMIPDTIIKSSREKLTRAVSSRSFLREPLGRMSSSMLAEAAGHSLPTPHLGLLLLGL